MIYVLITNGNEFTNTTIFKNLKQAKEAYKKEIDGEINNFVVLLKVTIGKEFGIGQYFDTFGGDVILEWNIDDME
jgi:hypothetical protein